MGRTWIDIFPNETYKLPVSVWRDAQYHSLPLSVDSGGAAVWWGPSCDARPGHGCPEGVLLGRAATATDELNSLKLYSLKLCGSVWQCYQHCIKILHEDNYFGFSFGFYHVPRTLMWVHESFKRKNISKDVQNWFYLTFQKHSTPF